VTPPTFTGEIVGDAIEVWVPLTMQVVVRPTQNLLAGRGTSWLIGLGRLRSGATLQQARTELNALVPNVIRQNTPSPASGLPANVAPDSAWVSSGAGGISSVRGTFRAPLLTLMAAVGLLLLIICSNVATLLLARAVARGREMGVRLAIGAGRSRLVRQLLTESLLLALLSAGAGLLVAWYGSALLLKLAPERSGVILLDTSLDARVLGFTIGLSVLCVGIFGLVPALRASRIDLAAAMRERGSALGGTSMGVRGQRVPIGSLLITGQVALSLVLLVAALLLGRSLRSVEGTDVGLDRDRLLVVDIDAVGRGYREDRLAILTRELTARLRRLPGVMHASFSENGIFSGTESGMSFQAPGFVPRTQNDSTIFFDQIGPGYVQAIGGRLLQGREFTDGDDVHAARVAMLNVSAAHFYFGTESPVGKIVRVDDVPLSVVGVLGDVRDHSLIDPQERRIYVPFLQRPLGDPGALRLVIRTNGDPARMATAVRAAVTAQDKLLLVWRADPLSRMMSRSIGEQRLVARLSTGFGGLALLLAAVGLYGVMTYAITRRTGEIGLRVALGAQRGTLLRMVLFDAMRVVAVGVVLGIPLSIASAQLLRSQLHGVSATDPVAIGVALAVLAGSCVLATLIPALRASRVTPLVALRQE
jgi:predicted permease